MMVQILCEILHLVFMLLYSIVTFPLHQLVWTSSIVSSTSYMYCSDVRASNMLHGDAILLYLAQACWCFLDKVNSTVFIIVFSLSPIFIIVSFTPSVCSWCSVSWRLWLFLHSPLSPLPSACPATLWDCDAGGALSLQAVREEVDQHRRGTHPTGPLCCHGSHLAVIWPLHHSRPNRAASTSALPLCYTHDWLPLGKICLVSFRNVGWNLCCAVAYICRYVVCVCVMRTCIAPYSLLHVCDLNSISIVVAKTLPSLAPCCSSLPCLPPGGMHSVTSGESASLSVSPLSSPGTPTWGPPVWRRRPQSQRPSVTSRPPNSTCVETPLSCHLKGVGRTLMMQKSYSTELNWVRTESQSCVQCKYYIIHSCVYVVLLNTWVVHTQSINI